MKYLGVIALLITLSATAQNPPQKVATNYQFQAAGADSALRLPKSKAVNHNFRDTAMLFYSRVDKKLHWTVDSTNDTTFVQGPGNVYRFNVLNFGAIRDSTVDNTAAFQRARLSCATANGGTVYIPDGVWLH